MKTGELIAVLASANPKLTRIQVKTVLDSVFAHISEAAAKGDEVTLAGFGKFKVQNRPARKGTNPRTGQPVEIAASKKLVFVAAKSVREAVAK